ncbi:MAG: hypothetical protein ABGW79_08310 [Pirellulales bacterium]|jgi:hypothetical protein
MHSFRLIDLLKSAVVVLTVGGVQLAFCGVGTAASIDVREVRANLLLQKEPAGAITPTAAKAAVAKGPKQIVIAGRIAGSKGMDPFVKGKASFAMLQLPDDHASQPGHNADDCPFCKKRLAQAPMVAVQFVGTDNKELPIDARDLFGVKDGEVVVIRGIASFNAKLALPIIQLQADGIYIRK